MNLRATTADSVTKLPARFVGARFESQRTLPGHEQHARSHSFGGLHVDEYTGHGMATLSTHPYPEKHAPHLRTSRGRTNCREGRQQEPLKSMRRSARSCPRCGSGRLDEMAQSSVKNATSILRCRVCGHVWMIRHTPLPVVAEGAASSPRACASTDDQSDDEGPPPRDSLNLIRRIWHQVWFRRFDPDNPNR